MQETQEIGGFDPWVEEIPWRKKWQPTPALLSGKSLGQRSLLGYSPWGCKESETAEHAHTYTITYTTSVLTEKVIHFKLISYFTFPFFERKMTDSIDK